MEAIEETIRRIQSGEIYLFANIVNEYQQRIYIYCLRLLRNEDEAEDAVQDIMLKVFEKIKSYHPKVTFTSWMYKVAYNHCLNLLRKRRIRQQFNWLFRQEVTAESAEQSVVKKMVSEPVADALSMLTTEERNLLILRVFEEKTFEEIGEILGKSMDAVTKKYGRVRQKMKNTMEIRGGEPCPKVD
ncbi:RNA polymerase sigma factor [Paenibacillus sonchi]|uniref:RNA polymerase sigma factor n=1 Tax=Paenibacillus sonchi TaxID=373687 RepID=UPI0005856D91|nr:sigma-70 family RNA polymerase sigma factor [Paenibacillus sonchi]MCE3199814.1 sigma-70 family RNA polymerase sigma factor [Paenibacillus sonchi]